MGGWVGGARGTAQHLYARAQPNTSILMQPGCAAGWERLTPAVRACPRGGPALGPLSRASLEIALLVCAPLRAFAHDTHVPSRHL